MFAPQLSEPPLTRVDRPTDDAAPLAPPRAERSPVVDRLQAVLGRDYEIGDLLGRGGFAEVYVAWDRKLKREVAVKTIRAELFATPDIMERFRREAEAIGRLRHPHIVPVYSVGEGEGVAYFIMPRVRGESLAEALEREPRWSFADVVRILREAAGALADAHRHGIVHRDIKPENIMLDGPERRVVVMDFGIAKSLDDKATKGLTGTGVLLGTPLYMSPEQAVGDRQVDHLSDQYSLALVGYRLLTGQMPFDADSVRSLLYQQVAVDVTPVRELRPDIPASLARAIERALEKEPSKRFESMDAFADALRSVASEVAGELRVGRRSPPMSERWSAARQLLFVRPRLAIAAGAIGLIAFALAYPRAEAAGARRMAGKRAEAFFTARSFIASRGGRTDVMRRDLWAFEPLYRFAQQSLPPDSVPARTARDVRVWSWDFSFYSASPRDAWWATIGPDGRVYRWQHILPSAATGESPPIPDAGDSVSRAIEQRVLAEHGWMPSDLVFLRRSVTPNARYTERRTTWQAPARRIGVGDDTALFVVSVATVGTQATEYSEGQQFVRVFESGLSSTTRRAIGSISVLVLAVSFFLAIAIAIRRADRDALQWRLAATIGAVPPLVILGTFVLPTMPAATVPFFLGDASRFFLGVNYVLRLSVEVMGPWVSTTLMLVAAESLLYEKRPDILGGMSDFVRGRFLIPELVPASVAAYGTGLAVIGGAYTIALAMNTLGVSPMPARLHLGWMFEIGVPLLAVVHVFGAAVWFTAVSLFFVAIALSSRRQWAVPAACVLTGLTFGLYRLADTQSSEDRIVLETLSLVATTWLLYRRGFLAAVLANFLIFGTPIAADFVWAGGETFFTTGLLGFTLLALPGVGALLAYRRRRTAADG